MIIKKIGQVFGLALFLFASQISALWAHALPGSTFIFSTHNSRLELTLSLPLEDLMIAAPALAQLDDIALGQDLSTKQLEILTAYFAKHFAIMQGQSRLALVLDQAKIERDENEHVGQFKLLVMEWDIKQIDDDHTSLTLIYDAVMHEVRNHRARIYWSIDGSTEQGTQEFGYRTAGGQQMPIKLLDHY